MPENDTPDRRLVDELRYHQDLHERKASLLSNRDREYLLDEHDTESANYERQIKQQIRERVTAGLLDVGILANHYPDDQLSQIFDLQRGTLFDHDAFPDYYHFYHQNWGRRLQRTSGPLEELDGDPEVEGRPEKRVAVTIFERILADVFTFTFRAALASNLPVDFEGLVETGLSRALRDYSKSATVDMDMFELSRESLRKKSETEGLNKEEFRILYDLENQSNTTRDGTEDGQQT